MKRNLLMAVSTEVAETLTQERSHEDEFKNTVKNKVTRQVKLIDPSLNE